MEGLRDDYEARVSKHGYFNVVSCCSSMLATVTSDLTKCGQTISTIVISENCGPIEVDSVSGTDKAFRITGIGSLERMEMAGVFRAIADCLEECDRRSEPKQNMLSASPEDMPQSDQSENNGR